MRIELLAIVNSPYWCNSYV